MALTVKKVYIYSLLCPITGDVKYIGKAENPSYRYRKHIEESLRGKVTKKCHWIKSLLNIDLKPILNIEDCVDESEWKFWEMYYISLYKSFGFDLKNGTNGGDGGKMSIEVIEKIRQSCKNRVNSESHKEKVRIFMKGNKHGVGGKSRSTKIECKNIQTGELISFDSISKAANVLNIKRTSIGNNLTGISKLVSNTFKFNYSC